MATGMTTVSASALPLQEAAAGDEAAFTRIVAACQRDMVRVAYAICGEQDAADDAVQAAFVIAWRKLSTVREPDSLRSWLVSVTANEARHLMRRRHHAHIAELEVDPPGRSAPDDAPVIGRIDLINALRRLSADERTLVALRYGADLESAEIGRVLGLSASGIRSRLARVMARLRKELEDG